MYALKFVRIYVFERPEFGTEQTSELESPTIEDTLQVLANVNPVGMVNTIFGVIEELAIN